MENRVAFRKTSLVDYPGKVAAVIFFQGCNLRCPWCYNGELVLGTDEELTPLENALSHIEKRKNVLGGVVLSGGEPLLQKDIGALITLIKRLGLLIKLDTNGTFPEKLEALIADNKTRPDFIAMDIKAPLNRYSKLCLPREAGAELSPLDFDKTLNYAEMRNKLSRSISLIKASGIPHEFRSIELPVLSKDDWEAMRNAAGEELKVRAFHSGNCLDERWNDEAFLKSFKSA